MAEAVTVTVVVGVSQAWATVATIMATRMRTNDAMFRSGLLLIQSLALCSMPKKVLVLHIYAKLVSEP